MNSPAQIAAAPAPSSPAVPVSRPLKPYCDRWASALRAMGSELRSMTDILLKWMAYDQNLPANTGSKWTKEEEAQLKKALEEHGTDIEKICEIMSSRSEQAIRAAIKRKIDPELVQKIGPIKKRKTAVSLVVQDSSPLASYFQTLSDDSATAPTGKAPSSTADAVLTSGSSAQQDKSGSDGLPFIRLAADTGVPAEYTAEPSSVKDLPEKKLGQTTVSQSAVEKSGSVPSGWIYGDTGIELTDQDFLTILEDDPEVLNGVSVLAGILLVETAKVRAEPFKADEILRERESTAMDIIFSHNFKAPMLDMAVELGVYSPHAGPDVVYGISDGAEEKPQEMLNGAIIGEQYAHALQPVKGSDLAQYLMESEAAAAELENLGAF